MGGRPLRIDLADSDPFLEGKTTVRGELIDGGTPGPAEPRSHWRGGGDTRNDSQSILALLPPGIQIPKGASAFLSPDNLKADRDAIDCPSPTEYSRLVYAEWQEEGPHTTSNFSVQ